jgi:hypothetical protein
MLKNKKFVLALLFVGLALILTSYYFKDSKYDSLLGLAIGYGFGLVGMSIACLFNIRFEEKNPDQAKSMAVEYADERNTLIRNRAKSKAADIIQVATLFSLSVFAILLDGPPWVVIALVLFFIMYQGLTLIYMFKYNQEM